MQGLRQDRPPRREAADSLRSPLSRTIFEAGPAARFVIWVKFGDGSLVLLGHKMLSD